MTWAITPSRWTRSSGACSPIRALIAAAALTLGQASPSLVSAQDQELDPVSIQAMSNAYIALRFVALTLEGPDEQGQALNGLVRANLAGERLDKALDEALRIEDGIWKARSLGQIAAFHAERGEIETALETLDQAAAADGVFGHERAFLAAPTDMGRAREEHQGGVALGALGAFRVVSSFRRWQDAVGNATGTTRETRPCPLI